MNGRLPILAGLVIALVLAAGHLRMSRFGVTLGAPSPMPGRDAERDEPTTTGSVAGGSRESAPDSRMDGQRLIAKAAREVFGHSSISARIRLQLHLFDQNLVGSGEYYQLGPDSDKSLRLDLKIRGADQESTIQVVCDGRYLWDYRDLPSVNRPGQRSTTLNRVDLREVRNRVSRQTNAATEPIPPVALIRGGLAHLLRGLQQNFEFRGVQSSTRSDVPLWVLHGHWKPRRLVHMLPEQRDAILAGKAVDLTELPEHLPHEVVVSLGQNDLFPYRIEYLRRKDPGHSRGPVNASPESVSSMVSIDIYEVALGGTIDSRWFQFKRPDNLEVEDGINGYLARLRMSRAL